MLIGYTMLNYPLDVRAWSSYQKHFLSLKFNTISIHENTIVKTTTNILCNVSGRYIWAAGFWKITTKPLVLHEMLVKRNIFIILIEPWNRIKNNHYHFNAIYYHFDSEASLYFDMSLSIYLSVSYAEYIEYEIYSAVIKANYWNLVKFSILLCGILYSAD